MVFEKQKRWIWIRHSTIPLCLRLWNNLWPVLLQFGIACACQHIARAASDLADTSLGTEEISFGDIADRWAQRGREAREKGEAMLSPPAASKPSASASVTWDTKSSFGQTPRVSH